ncbi:MAG: multicopper oxidase domain-containing protein [Deltaproteobacteria bacterium]
MAIRHYVLLATDGFIDLPNVPDLCTADRTPIYVFGFVGGLFKVNNKVVNPVLDWLNPGNWQTLYNMRGTATIPSPMIWGEVGDHIYITLLNIGMLNLPNFMDFHTVHMHGAHVATQLDGFPESSFGVPMWMDPATQPPSATYFFHPEGPGTYMYHCHVEASEHVQMGMYGALVIYPSMESLAEAGITRSCCGQWKLHGKVQHQIPKTATNRNFAYNDINTFFDKEYVMLLSDIDSTWHNAVLTSDPTFNPVNFKPDYWLVNGRAFPDTLLPHPQTPAPGSDPDLAQINYESYVHVNTGDKFLLRMINMGYQVVPWHIHGWHFTVVGKDAHPSPFLTIAAKLKLMEHEGQEMGFTNTIGSGETYDLILMADDKRPLYREYIVKGQDGIPSLCSQMTDIQEIDPAAIFDIPTEPVSCPSPNTVNYVNICHGTQGNDRFFPQFYPMHNHDDYKVTNNGAYPGGQLTFIQADEPKPCDSIMDDIKNLFNFEEDNLNESGIVTEESEE